MNKTVLITGARRGLGRALTEVFSNNGWFVIALVRSDNDEHTRVANSENVTFITADVSDQHCIEQITDQLHQITDHVDLLINNAGIPGDGCTITETSASEISRLLDVHCLGIVNSVQACLPLFKASEKAQIVNVSSRLGSLSRIANEVYSLNVSYAYRIAKAAQNMLSICMYHDLKKRNIEVRAVHPGRLLTQIAQTDADTSVELAAEQLFCWIQKEVSVFGLYDLGNEQFIEW